MTIYGNFPIIPLYNFMEKNWKATTLCIISWKKLENDNMSVLYPNLCYNEVCYK